MDLLESLLLAVGAAALTVLDFILYYALVTWTKTDPLVAAVVVVCLNLNAIRLRIKS